MGAFCTIFQARPVGTGLGAKFGRKPAKSLIKIIISITYPKRRCIDSVLGPIGADGGREASVDGPDYGAILPLAVWGHVLVRPR